MDFVYEKGPENRACFFIGGGENRTLVLSKRRIDDYMLSALWLSQPCRKAPRSGLAEPFLSRIPVKTVRKDEAHSRMYDGGTLELPVRSQATG